MRTQDMTLKELNEERERIKGEIEDRFEEVNQMNVRFTRDSIEDVAYNLEWLAKEIRDLGVDLDDIEDEIDNREEEEDE